MNGAWQYIVLLGAFIVVCALMLPRKKQALADQNQAVLNMELALEQFMQNMEGENQELVDAVSRTQKQWREEAAGREQRMQRLEAQCAALEQQLALQTSKHEVAIAELQALLKSSALAVPAVEASPNIARTQSAAVELEVMQEEPEAPLIRERYADLFALHEQGKSIEYIAKKSGLNKGEVQLILQLSRQEERHRG